MKIVYRLVHYHILWCLIDWGFNNKVLSFFLGLNQKKVWDKIQHQIQFLKPVYMASNMTALTRMTTFEYAFCIV